MTIRGEGDFIAANETVVQNGNRNRLVAGCIPRNADGNSSMWDSVGLVHASLSAALCRNRKIRTATESWRTDDRDSVHGIRVDSRDSRAVLFLPTNHANECESKSALWSTPLRSGQSSRFPIPHCTALRPRNLRTDYKLGNAPRAASIHVQHESRAAALASAARNAACPPDCLTAAVVRRRTATRRLLFRHRLSEARLGPVTSAAAPVPGTGTPIRRTCRVPMKTPAIPKPLRTA